MFVRDNNLSHSAWNNKVENTVEKWHHRFLEIHDTQKALHAYTQAQTKGLTNVRIGPPVWLKAQEKASWHHQLQLVLRKCISCIQLPAQQASLSNLWNDLNATIIKVGNNEFLEEVGLRINKGLKRGSNKLYKKNYSFVHNNSETPRGETKSSIPPPPPPPPHPQLPQHKVAPGRICRPVEQASTLTKEKEIEAPPISELPRGEEFTPLRNIFEIFQAFKPTEDLAGALAFGIFGSKKRVTFLYRSLYKYMLWYEKTEREAFKPGVYMTRKGNKQRSYTWGRWKEVVKKGECMLDRKQVNVIARLYQVQIRFFKCGEEKGLRFVCTGQSPYLQHRVINVLKTEKDTWTLLQGTTAPVFRFDSSIGKFDTDFYLAGCGFRANEVRSNKSIIETIDKEKVVEKEEGQQEKETINRDIQREATPLPPLRDRIYSDTNSSMLLSPASIERRLEVEQERGADTKSPVLLPPTPIERRTEGEQDREVLREDKSEVSEEESSEVRALFPSELVITRPERIKVSKRQVWQRRHNLVRSKNRLANKKYVEAIAQEERRKDSHKAVFDYTTGRLTESEIDILSKGETFCPTTHTIDLDRLKTDIYQYSRKLRLHEQFREKQATERDIQQRRSRNTVTTNRDHTAPSRVSTRRRNTHTTTATLNTNNTSKQRHLPSTYDPLTQNRNLNRYTTCIQEDCLLATKSEVNIKDNIHKHHRTALKTLKHRIDSKTIMITKADKGSGIVVCDYDTYVEKGTKYIEEEAGAYTKVADTEVDLITKLTKHRNKIVDKLRKESVIPLQTATFCTKQVEEKITGMKFYFKIHKDQNIATTPLRPLQSCISAPTHHLSLVLTDILQPLLSTKNIPSFIYDSNHLLFRLQTLGAIPKNCTIISSDVSALYPSIPHQQGLEATKEFLAKYTQYNTSQIETLMQALKLVISENYVMWNNSIYKQTSGVAMGTPVAVAYANIFMAWVDSKVRQQTNYIHEHIRFIDDNLFIIPEEKIGDLMHLANNILPSIKYTHEKLDKNSNKGLVFLDTQLFISQQGHIEARLYTKPTDRHAYLLPSSYHPPHIVKNIPSAVFKRLRRLCSKKEWFLEDAEKAKSWLKNRGYKEKEITKALETAANLNRWDMIVKIEANRGIAKTSVEDVHRIPFIVTYSKFAKVFKQVLVKRQELLDSSYKYSKVQPRVTFRRQKNLDDILIQKALRGPIRRVDKEEYKFGKCGDKQQYRGQCPCRVTHELGLCRCCAHAFFGKINEKVQLRKKVDCNTKNVVYLIGCRKCDKQYIGETQQTVRDRLAQHLSNIAKLNQPLYLHFRQVHSPSNLFITILETVRNTEQFFRKVREVWWINHLQTLEPKGFNAKLDCNQIYQESHR